MLRTRPRLRVKALLAVDVVAELVLVLAVTYAAVQKSIIAQQSLSADTDVEAEAAADADEARTVFTAVEVVVMSVIGESRQRSN